MTNEPEHITDRKIQPFHYYRTVSIPVRSITTTPEQMQESEGEVQPEMGEDYYEGDEGSSRYYQTETIRSCLACLEYLNTRKYPHLKALRDDLTFKCLDVIAEVVKNIHAEIVTE